MTKKKATVVDGVVYELTSAGSAKVAGTTAEFVGGEVMIPNRVEIDGRMVAVKRIVTRAFSKNTALTAIVLPASVGNVDYGAFAGCTALERVECAEVTVTNRAFQGCTALRTFEGDIRLASDMEEGAVFDGCTSLEAIEGEIEVENGPEGYGCGIPEKCFKDCKKLRTLTVNEYFASPQNRREADGEVGYGAFAGCEALQEVGGTFLMGFIYDGAFEGCGALKTLNIRPRYILSRAFSGCTSLDRHWDCSELEQCSPTAF